MNLENVVRPFQSVGVFTARSNVPSPPPDTVDTPDTATATWAGSQSSTWQATEPPILTSFKSEWTEDTNQRETETVRVSNPKNNSQYVDVERIKKAVFVNPSTGAQLPLKMGAWDDGRK
jgi:hypothetical protein